MRQVSERERERERINLNCRQTEIKSLKCECVLGRRRGLNANQKLVAAIEKVGFSQN
jgi:hypothetical protein